MQNNLSQNTASQRSQVISDVKYQIHLDLKQQSDTYVGECTLCFSLKSIPETLPVDFIYRDITEATLNSKPISIQQSNCTILLPVDSLQLGENRLKISYINKFDHHGTGLHRFVDSEDNKEYIFSDLEPFEAHRIFPCFDQPDLKAPVKLSVNAPAQWVIRANSIEEKIVHNSESTLYHFLETPPIATYLFALTAGDYYIAGKDDSKSVPMMVLCRQSMKQYCKPQEMMDLTATAITFFESYLNQKFPFSKYDQIFVPEFTNGAMENVGLVTFHESYLFRGEPTKTQTYDFHNTIVHELCHMWFGNLVTMSWWGDLWLNESFATYLAYYALQNIKGHEDSMLYFIEMVKNSALFEDSLSTTHPIEAHCPDTASAEVIFDAITYEKGASIIQQLCLYLGHECFQNLCQNYISRFKYQNAAREDFLDLLSEVAKRDMNQWYEQWFKKQSLNTLSSSMEIEDGKISSFHLHQTPDACGELREHATQLLFISKGKSEVHKAHYCGLETEITTLCGLPEPEFIYLNYEDYDFCHIHLPAKSVSWFQENYKSIADKPLKKSIFNTISRMVLDAKFCATEQLELMLSLEEQEPDDSMILAPFSDCIHNMYSLTETIPESLFNSLKTRCMKRMQDSCISRDRLRLWFKVFNYLARINHELCDYAITLLETNEFPSKEKVEIDEKWALVTLLAAHLHPTSIHYCDALRLEDPSDTGRLNEIKIKTLLDQDKLGILRDALTNEKESTSTICYRLNGLFSQNQVELNLPAVKPYFDALNQVYSTKDKIFSMHYVRGAFPMFYPQVEEYAKEALNKGLPDTAATFVKKNLDLLELREKHLKVFTHKGISKSK
jgi:aminopeptidase N